MTAVQIILLVVSLLVLFGAVFYFVARGGMSLQHVGRQST